eukprot:4165494-Lingulodinium_polyedra.AAC.1
MAANRTTTCSLARATAMYSQANRGTQSQYAQDLSHTQDRTTKVILTNCLAASWCRSQDRDISDSTRA